jgi:hypothetical protein
MIKKIFYSLFLCFLCLNAACSRVPDDMFPKTVGAFKAGEKPDSFKDASGNKSYSTDYSSPDNKKIRCRAVEYPSPEAAINFVRHEEDIVRIPGTYEATPIAGTPGKDGGYRIISYYSGDIPVTSRVWILRWNKGSRAYNCGAEGEEKTTIPMLEEFEKNWRN